MRCSAGGGQIQSRLCAWCRSSAGRVGKHCGAVPPAMIASMRHDGSISTYNVPPSGLTKPMISGQQALAQLREGNRRFVASIRDPAAPLSQPRPVRLPLVQEPFAIVLGCSDSRVPAELVFGQGFGDLFVIRVAGNIVAPSQVGSVEFAAARFGTRLVVVLGHSQCGAIVATLEELRRPTENQSRNLRAIVDRVRPSVEGLLETDLGRDLDALVKQAVRLNIRASADHLRHGSEVLEQLIQDDGLQVVGAEYSLETGVVEFFDGLSARRPTKGRS